MSIDGFSGDCLQVMGHEHSFAEPCFWKGSADLDPAPLVDFHMSIRFVELVDREQFTREPMVGRLCDIIEIDGDVIERSLLGVAKNAQGMGG
jgi:hypothetical protein